MAMQSVISPYAITKPKLKVTQQKPQEIITEATPENHTRTRKMVGNPTTGYYPILSKMTAEDKFDFELGKGTKLRNGATLIRPIILSLGKLSVKPIDNGRYEVTSSQSGIIKRMTEKELMDTKWIYRGMIKQVDKDCYAISYTDKNDEAHIEKVTKQEAMNILKENAYYM